MGGIYHAATWPHVHVEAIAFRFWKPLVKFFETNAIVIVFIANGIAKSIRKQFRQWTAIFVDSVEEA